MLASKANQPANRAIPSGRVVWEPQKSASGPFSILLSYADRTVYIWRNGIQIGQSPIGIEAGAQPPEGVFLMLEGRLPYDPRFPNVEIHPWSVLTLDGGTAHGNAVESIRSLVTIPPDFQKRVSDALTPGAILVATSESSNASTRSGRDFTIMRPEAKPTP